jgi:hypothetical protein
MVAGRIEFLPERPQLKAADVHVWIEDVTYADAPAVRVFEQRMAGVAYEGEPDGLPFTLDYNPEPSNRSYNLGVLVDLDGDSKAGRGDYVSYQAVALPLDGSVARVRVQRIS